LARGGWRDDLTDRVYESIRELYQDTAAIVRDDMTALVAQGVNYLQSDEAFASYAREGAPQQMRDQGKDPELLLADQIEFENQCYDAVRGTRRNCRGPSLPRQSLARPKAGAYRPEPSGTRFRLASRAVVQRAAR
jgi:hypothetical protein